MADQTSRPNTLEEKRRMRKKRRRSRVKELEEKLCNEKALRTEATHYTKICLGRSGNGGTGSCNKGKSVKRLFSLELAI